MAKPKKDDSEALNTNENTPPEDKVNKQPEDKTDEQPKPPDENTPPEDKVNKQPEDKTDEQPKPPEGETKTDGAVIDPIAFEIKLKSIHPQATYGRCGYRFNKETAVEIPREALTGEQIITLAEDPYLEFVPVVEA